MKENSKSARDTNNNNQLKKNPKSAQDANVIIK